MATHSRIRSKVKMLLKFALAGAILAFLVVQAHDGVSRIRRETIDWSLVAIGMACTLVTVVLNFVRWHLLIRALDIPIRLRQTMKLGALGYALNFVSPGAIGGDFFRAAFLAHGRPGQRTESVATVIADRIVGLLTMLVLASCGIVFAGLLSSPSLPLRVLSKSILIVALVVWGGFGLLLFVPALTGSRVTRRLQSIRRVGTTFARLVQTVQVYRAQKHILLLVFGISTVMALFFVSSFYWIARGLPINEPSWREHLVIGPVAGLVGAIPVTPSGLGTMELAVEEMYRALPGGDARRGAGTLVALTRRVTELFIALLGVFYYAMHRRKVDEVYHAAEEAAEQETT